MTGIPEFCTEVNISEKTPIKSTDDQAANDERAKLAIEPSIEGANVKNSDQKVESSSTQGDANGEATRRLAMVDSHSLALLSELTWFVITAGKEEREIFRRRFKQRWPYLLTLIKALSGESELENALKKERIQIQVIDEILSSLRS